MEAKGTTARPQTQSATNLANSVEAKISHPTMSRSRAHHRPAEDSDKGPQPLVGQLRHPHRAAAKRPHNGAPWRASVPVDRISSVQGGAQTRSPAGVPVATCGRGRWCWERCRSRRGPDPERRDRCSGIVTYLFKLYRQVAMGAMAPRRVHIVGVTEMRHGPTSYTVSIQG